MADEIVESLVAALKAMSAVTDLVGTGNDARIVAWLKQDVDIPANGTIFVERDSIDHKTNDLLGLGGLPYFDVNILVRAPTASAASVLAEAIRVNGTDPGTGLAGFSDTPLTTLVDATLIDTTGPIVAVRDDGSTLPYFDINMTFECSQNEVI